MEAARASRLRTMVGLALVVILAGALVALIRFKRGGYAPIDVGLATKLEHRSEQAARLASAGKADAAVKLYREIVADATRQIAEFEANRRHVATLHAEGKEREAIAEARKLCDRFLKHRHDDPLIEGAEEFAVQGEMKQAVERYLDVLQRYSVGKQIGDYTIGPRLAIGELYRAQGRFDPAEAEYRAVIQDAAQVWQKANALIGLGDIMAARKLSEKAAGLYQRAVDLARADAPFYAAAALRLAATQRELGRFGEAEQLLHQVLLNPTVGKAQAEQAQADFLGVIDERAAAAEKNGGPLQAVQVYLASADKYGEIAEWAPQWRLKAARCYLRGRRYDLARLTLGRLWRNRPGEADPIWNEANAEREAVDEAERTDKSSAFIEGIRPRADSGDYRCVIVESPIEGNTVWSPSNGEYVVNGRVTVPANAKLTIQAGTVVKFTVNSCLIVYGALKAVGEPVSPIVFESSAPRASPFDWGLPAHERAAGGIQFVGRPGGVFSMLEHCVIRHAAVGVLCEEASPSLEQCQITQTGVVAVSIESSASPAIRNCELTGNDGDGLLCKLSSSPSIQDCRIEQNGQRGMVFGQNCEPKVENVTVRRNVGAGLLYYDAAGGTVSRSSIIDNNGPGINCETVSAPVVTDSVIWGNLGHGVVAATRSTPTIQRCRIQQNVPGGVLCQAATPTLRNCAVVANNEFGVRFTLKAEAHLELCEVQANPVGLLVEEVSEPVVRNCSLAGNTRFSVVHRGEKDLDLSGNWWGTIDPGSIEKLIRGPSVRGAARVIADDPLSEAPAIGEVPKEP